MQSGAYARLHVCRLWHKQPQHTIIENFCSDFNTACLRTRINVELDLHLYTCTFTKTHVACASVVPAGHKLTYEIIHVGLWLQVKIFRSDIHRRRTKTALSLFSN